MTDREAVKKHYSRELKAWMGDLGDGKHDGGPEDPRIGVIKVKVVTATYALAKGSLVGRGLDIAKGVVTGSAPNIHNLREISTTEVETCKY